MKHSRRRRALALALVPFLWSLTSSALPEEPPRGSVDGEGTVHLPASAIPLSPYMSEQARRAFIRLNQSAAHPDAQQAEMSEEQQRAGVDDFHRPWLERSQELYPVSVVEHRIGKVRTDFVSPRQGVSARNRHRILISLHGGSFHYASGGLVRLLEAETIGGYARITVVSVDYRTSPDYQYPAAVEDVIAVYRELLKTHRPESIGMYGCSTGAALTGMTLAWLQQERLPRPGAVGLFCEGAIKDDQIEGDSYYVSPALTSATVPNAPYPPNPYMSGTDARDPLVAPIVSLDVLSRFPPTLLLSGTRDLGLSGVLYTHSRLVKAGVEAELHVWDGMWHGFFADPDLPESKEAYKVISRFFDRHLSAN